MDNLIFRPQDYQKKPITDAEIIQLLAELQVLKGEHQRLQEQVNELSGVLNTKHDAELPDEQYV